MRILRIAAALTSLAGAVAAFGCGDAHDPPATQAAATATVAAPSSTATPGELVRRVELPRDEAGAWSPRAILSTTEQVVVVYDPVARSPEEQRKLRSRIGLMPLAGGAVRELHATEPGRQIGRVAHDGRYLAWVEVGVFGASPLSWSLFAVDLDVPGAAPLEVDSGPGDLPWLPVQGPPLSVTAGRLVYSRYVPEGGDWRNELLVAGLAGGASEVVDSGLIADAGHITAIAATGDSFAWVRRKMGVTPPPADSTLFEASFASFAAPATTLVNASLFEIALAERSVVVATVADGLLIRGPGSAGFEGLTVSTGIPMYLSVAGDRAYWVDTGSLRPMALSLGAATPSTLDDEETLMVFDDDGMVAWWTKRDRRDVLSIMENRP